MRVVFGTDESGQQQAQTLEDLPLDQLLRLINSCAGVCGMCHSQGACVTQAARDFRSVSVLEIEHTVE